ncbi:MAG TPA: Ig-like domain-containing protein [Acidisphaera sp.]|nr:Ig-like domain-containing protein [Acidisphaera sp.]
MRLVVGLAMVAMATWAGGARAADLAELPPVVIRSTVVPGSVDVPSSTSEIGVTFSKEMKTDSFSVVIWKPEAFPQLLGNPAFQADRRTVVLKVKLAPMTTYAIWLNSDRFTNFRDTDGHPAVPYLVSFRTGP